MKRLHRAVVPMALIALTSTAWAQSSVTLSGRVDLGLKRAPADLTKGTNSVTALDESSNGRLQFSGREDLGSDLTAFFVLETRFNADTGVLTEPAVFWRDKAWVGLSGKSWGEFKLGRVHSPQFGVSTAGRYEAFSGDSYGSMGSRGAVAANQWNNSIYYTTSTFGGFNAGLVYQAGEAVVANGVGAHLAYAKGPFAAAASYQSEQDRWVAAGTVDKMKTYAMGAYYDFGVVRLSGTYARTNDGNITNTGTQTVYTLGARVPVGSGEFRTSYRKVDDTARKSLKDASSDADSNRFSVGYHHPLSKRTSVNLSLVREEQIRFNANGSVKTNFSGSGFEAALRHNF
jgi:predicted porin